ncbi:hypothetical protein GTR02_00970 [Kineococcus sp. R8]|uniref:hypothetical protein n=1 Tax=Kineococcus siccus TaxID=2696567 RepID=UPI001412C3C5|nr:hypothetical protein [Kineococcus siccus]NAZ80390.1 hypothetical protein [Kineococcus siccus]
MPRIPSALLVPSSVVAGFAVGRRTGRRALAGVALAAGLAAAAPRWATHRSPLTAAAAAAVTVALVGASHPLSRRLGTWPAVLATGAATGVVSAWADGGRGRP